MPSRRWVSEMIDRAVCVEARTDKRSHPILALGKHHSHSYSFIPKTFGNGDVTHQLFVLYVYAPRASEQSMDF